jgi:UDP-N-acetylglucosamine diphosphorylase / glucose-1-phosphate thymidylyltransferase / UDP-N-acetylgalactosamine diphosphorylase / glucosamine-1-phosphate N-acetyltransferase / galactosamine-1-phosphate N-acetyltransferase
MRAVILAAGDGGRLQELTTTLPKPLVPLAGRPIIDYTLEALIECGIFDVTIVTGYREEQLRAALAESVAPALTLRFVPNERFHGAASLSLRAARAYVHEEPFLLLMADHLLSSGVIGELCRAHAERPCDSFVAADFSHHDSHFSAEATKVLIAEGPPKECLVGAIGKDLARWDALDAGAFLFHPSAWEAVDASPEDCELSVIFTELARRKGLVATDVSGSFWYDVDTAEDLANATAMIAEAESA